MMNELLQVHLVLTHCKKCLLHDAFIRLELLVKAEIQKQKVLRVTKYIVHVPSSLQSSHRINSFYKD